MKTGIDHIVSTLTQDERQLLKDTINCGFWGDCSYEFRNEIGVIESVGAWGFCTNDASEAGNFKGRQVSTMFRRIYKKMCPEQGIGERLSHCSDWWGDGSGDMLFVRESDVDDFRDWANR